MFKEYTIHAMYIRNHIICLVLILSSLIYVATAMAVEQKRLEEMIKKQEVPSLQGNVVTLNLLKYFTEEEQPSLEFAYDGSPYILAWSWPSEQFGDYRKGMVKQVVLNLDGNIVKTAFENDNFLTEKFIRLFPNTSWRQKWHSFVKDADGWGFSKDWHFGARLFGEKNGPDHFWKIELYELGSDKKLWEVSLPEISGDCELVRFLDFNGEKAILIAFSGSTAYLVSRSDGSIIKTIYYTPHTSLDVDFPSFCASYIDYNSKYRLLACGDLSSRKVNLIKVDAPNDIVTVLNRNDKYANLYGGSWSVVRVQFYAGKFLVIEYHFGGRGTAFVFEPTEIYDIDKMKLCWRENSLDVSSVALSPDGRKLAFMHDMILEIGSFILSFPKTPSSPK